MLTLCNGFFIRNRGDEIAFSDYFDSPLSYDSVPFLSWSGACARLLLPAHRADVADLIQGASRAVLRLSGAAPIRARRRLDILFDDEYDALTATLVRGALSDVVLDEEDHGLEFKLSVWTPSGSLVVMPGVFWSGAGAGGAVGA